MNKYDFDIYNLEPGRISTFIIDAMGGPMPFSIYTQGNPERKDDEIETFIFPNKGDFAYELLYFAWLIYHGMVDCKYRKRKKKFELIPLYWHELPDASTLLGPTAFPDLYTLAMQMRLADAGDYLFDEDYYGLKIWRRYPFKLDRASKSKFYYYHGDDDQYEYYRMSMKKSVSVGKVSCVSLHGLSYHKGRDLRLYDRRVEEGYRRRKTLRLEELQEVPVIAKLLNGYVEN